MILPGMGVVSELIPCFFAQGGLRLQVRRLVERLRSPCSAFLSGAITCSSAGIRVFAGLVFSLMSFLVAVPSAIKVFNWTATLHKGSIRFDAPMLYALGFIGLFTIGGLTGLFLASLAARRPCHRHLFRRRAFPLHHGRRHGDAPISAACIIWWPKITGRLYPECWARAAAILIFFGFNLTFFPQFILGYLGMPRRYHAYPPEFQVWNVLSSAGASILAVAYRAAAVLSRLVAVLRPRAPAPIRGRPPASNGRRRRRRPSIISSNAGRDARSLRLHAQGRGARRKMPERSTRHFSLSTCASSTTWRELGMWVFLATEVLFFGGLILVYCVYRLGYPGGLCRGRRATPRSSSAPPTPRSC